MISGKGSAASVNGAAGGLSPSAGDLRSEPLRKFLGSKEHLDWLNNTHRENFVLLNSVQEFIEIQNFAAPDLFPMFTQAINFCMLYCHKIKEFRCLKNVIHQLEINKWLVHVFTQENTFS